MDRCRYCKGYCHKNLAKEYMLLEQSYLNKNQMHSLKNKYDLYIYNNGEMIKGEIKYKCTLKKDKICLKCKCSRCIIKRFFCLL